MGVDLGVEIAQQWLGAQTKECGLRRFDGDGDAIAADANAARIG